MIHFSKLGRYEYCDYARNSDKFYCIRAMGNDRYEITYGKNGYGPQQTLEVDAKVAARRIKEKIAKGYTHVDSDLDDEHQKIWMIYTKERYETLLKEKEEKNEPQARRVKI